MVLHANQGGSISGDRIGSEGHLQRLKNDVCLQALAPGRTSHLGISKAQGSTNDWGVKNLVPSHDPAARGGKHVAKHVW